MSVVGFYIFTKLRPWLRRLWQLFSGFFRKDGTSGITVTVSKAPTLDAIGTWLLVLAIVLLTLWNRKIEHETHQLHVEMVRYVLPRHLDKEQIDIFSKYLAENSKPREIDIKYLSGDEESKEYASDFYSAFTKGGWLPSMSEVNLAIIVCDSNPTGNPLVICKSNAESMADSLEKVSVDIKGPSTQSAPLTLEQKLHPPKSAMEILGRAFNAANIQNGGYGSSGNDNDPAAKITLFIGHRPRGRMGILPPDFLQRLQNFHPYDVTDEDFK